MEFVYDAERVPDFKHLFYKKGENGRLELFIAKVADDLLMAGFPTAIANFTTALDQRFQLGHVETESILKFLGCHIRRGPAKDLQLSMTDYFQCIYPV